MDIASFVSFLQTHQKKGGTGLKEAQVVQFKRVLSTWPGEVDADDVSSLLQELLDWLDGWIEHGGGANQPLPRN